MRWEWSGAIERVSLLVWKKQRTTINFNDFLQGGHLEIYLF